MNASKKGEEEREREETFSCAPSQPSPPPFSPLSLPLLLSAADVMLPSRRPFVRPTGDENRRSAAMATACK